MAEKKLTGYPSIDMPWMKQYSGGDSASAEMHGV